MADPLCHHPPKRTDALLDVQPDATGVLDHSTAGTQHKDDPLCMGYYYGFGAFNSSDEWVGHHLSLVAGFRSLPATGLRTEPPSPDGPAVVRRSVDSSAPIDVT